MVRLRRGYDAAGAATKNPACTAIGSYLGLCRHYGKPATGMASAWRRRLNLSGRNGSAEPPLHTQPAFLQGNNDDI